MDVETRVSTRTVEESIAIECERCDAEEFLGFRECRACARVLDPRRSSATSPKDGEKAPTPRD